MAKNSLPSPDSSGLPNVFAFLKIPKSLFLSEFGFIEEKMWKRTKIVANWRKLFFRGKN
jgi:hypothetical protein